MVQPLKRCRRLFPYPYAIRSTLVSTEYQDPRPKTGPSFVQNGETAKDDALNGAAEPVLTCFQADEAAEGIRNVHTRFADVSARLQHLRNLLNSDRPNAGEQRRAIEALDQEVDHMNHEQQYAALSHLHASNHDRSRAIERRRPYVDASLNSEDRATNRIPPPIPSGLSPSNLVRTRRRAFRPSERLTRSQRERLGQGASLMPSPSYSTPPPRPSPPLQDEAMREYAVEAQTNRESRYRAKRRKLDDGTYEDESKAITYGWKGQVVPGQLKLEIITCDGGEFSDPHVPLNSFPQNVLQDDAAVYCTKSNKCNMLLKHASGMPFSLTKMVFKAPRSGYDAPIQEGMIFVALDDADLMEKTARYEIHYSPRSYRYHRQYFEATRATHQYLSSERSPLRSIDRSRYLRDPREPPPAWHRYVENDPLLESAVISGFSVTTGDPSDDEDITPEGPSSPRPWHEADPEYSFRSYADRYRPVYADSERPTGHEYSAPTSDSEDGEATILDNLLRTAGRAPREDSPDPGTATDDGEPSAELRPYVNRRSAPSRIGLRSFDHSRSVGPPDPIPAEAYEHLGSDPGTSMSKSHADATAASSSAAVADTLAPHARFFIPPHKSSVAVKFEPHV